MTSPQGEVIATHSLTVAGQDVDAIRDTLAEVAPIGGVGVPLGWLAATMPFDRIHIPISAAGPYRVATTARDTLTRLAPLQAGDRLTATLIRDAMTVRRTEGGEPTLALLPYRRRLCDSSGEHIAECIWTGALLPFPRPARAASEITVDTAGAEPQLRTRVLDMPLLERWSEISKDHDPIHLDAGVAAAAGLPAPAAHASLVTSLAEALLTAQLETALSSLDVRHRAPAHPGDELWLTLRTTDGEATMWCERGLIARCRYTTATDNPILMSRAAVVQ